MERFKVKVGDYDLIESGSVITMKDADIHFFIKDLEYVFRFTQTEEKEVKMRIVSNTGKQLIVELQNFDSSLGAGNVDPIPMGKMDGCDIFILFRIAQLSEGGKTMHYSWLSKPIQSNNEGHEER